MADYTLNAVLSHRRDLTPELAIFRVRPDSGLIVPFEPGQYAELAIPTAEQLAAIAEGQPPGKVVRRSYSIASAPQITDALEFFIVHVPGGEITPRLWSLKEGDRLWLGPKIKGKFTIAEAPADKTFVMVATGTGVSPFVSMLREYHDKGRWQKAVLIHGARVAADLGYADELIELARSRSDFIYIPTLTREPENSDWNGLRGRVPVVFDDNVYRELTGSALNPAESQVFLCGNPAMIDTVQELLEGKGFSLHSKKHPGNIHFERFW